MRRRTQPCLLILVCFVSSCAVQHTYYLSPLDINSNYYHSIPVHDDSSKSASTYAGLAFAVGNSNYQSRDNLYMFQGHIHRSHNFGHFQAYYGAGLTLGSYHVSSYSLNYFHGFPIRDTSVQINPESDHTFGAIGLNGGINLVVPLPRGGEWRAIGIETAIQREFGSYLNFRKSLVDSAFDILATYTSTKTIGLTTEFVWVRRSGTELGYKISLGGSIVSPNNFLGIHNADVPFYFSHCLHLTIGKITGFWQLNFGSHCDSFQFGLNYRFQSARKSFRQ